MTNFLIALVIVVVGGGAFLYFQQAEAPVMEDAAMMDDSTEHMEGDAMMNKEGDTMKENAMMEDGTITEGDAMHDSMMAEPTITVDLSGKNFEFSKKEIRVKEGDVVKINFTSESGFHDWTIDEFNAKTAQVQTGNTSSVTFTADKHGTFEYYCSVGQHRANGMVGKLIVE